MFAAALAATATAQVYSPRVLRQGQADTSSVASLAHGICGRAGAVTDREKAEAIWRFFLTDGRFVRPGLWYRLDGWACEEPGGQVLDPLKLLNSYGFGSSAQVAPLLEAVWEAAGFPDARVWSLGGHTVAEVFYEGGYHYYDSDLMGYTTVDRGAFRLSPVASVRKLEQDSSVLLGKLRSRTEAIPDSVDYPWYPAELKQGLMESVARLFTTAEDNRLFPYRRYQQGHTMDFVLRPGERIIRNFSPERQNLYYFPFAHEDRAPLRSRAEGGPRSGADDRTWATGRIEYTPVLGDIAAYYPEFGRGFNLNLRLPRRGASTELTRLVGIRDGSAVFEMPSPYVIIDARIALRARLDSNRQTLAADISADAGRTWAPAGVLRGPYQGPWEARPPSRPRAERGGVSIVSGAYSYLVRLRMEGRGEPSDAAIDELTITTFFQLNPRTLPRVAAGRNEMVYRPGAAEVRHSIPVREDQLSRSAWRSAGTRYVAESGQGFLVPLAERSAAIIFELAAPGGAALTGFDAGGRFLDIRGGLAPDKFSGEPRKTAVRIAGAPAASLDWSLAPDRDFKPLWNWDEDLKWRDGDRIDRVLRWPEFDVTVSELPPGTKKVYVRYRFGGLALDSIRLSVRSRAPSSRSPVEITHVWREGGQARRHVERIAPANTERRYLVEAGPSRSLTNEAVIFYCPPVL